jgi:hypothetical protein
MLEVVEGGNCLLKVLQVLDGVHCVLLCMLEAVEGRFCLPEVIEESLVRKCCGKV